MTARDELAALELPAPTIQQVLEKTGAGRSRSYELKARLVESLSQLSRKPGRPRETEKVGALAEPPSEIAELRLATLRFERRHPGAVHAVTERTRYSDSLRRHVLSLRQRYSTLDLADFAKAIDIPLSTMKEWSSPLAISSEPESSASDEPGTGASQVGRASELHIQTVLSEWSRWCGDFLSFCTHVAEHSRVPLGRTAISSILEAHGVRLRKRRTGRSPDEEALRDTFQTFFAGAQWVGDGKAVSVTLDGERFTFNFELVVDAATGALTGATVTDAEDALAVVDAFEAGIETTGEAPLALLLDNRPSNHAPEVDAVLGESTIKIRATPARPQNKAHVEGAFGLFAQTIPPLILATTVPRETARQILLLVVETWARAMNNRPRRDRQNRSRAELYREQPPTPEQIAVARAELAERLRKQELARQTLLARQDPVILQLIDEALHRLALSDPGGHFRAAMARHGRDAVIEGIAIFSAKREEGTLPPDIDVRYLLGIVANVARDNELCAITEQLIEERMHARDMALSLLMHERDAADGPELSLQNRIEHHVDRACNSTRKLDRFFWLGAATETITSTNSADSERAEWLRFASSRLHAATHLSHRERLDALRLLARRVLSVT